MLLQLEKTTHCLSLPFSLFLSPHRCFIIWIQKEDQPVYVQTPLQGPLPSVTPSTEIYSRGAPATSSNRKAAFAFLGFSSQLGILGPYFFPFSGPLSRRSQLWACPALMAARGSWLTVPSWAASSASLACCPPGGSNPLLQPCLPLQVCHRRSPGPFPLHCPWWKTLFPRVYPPPFFVYSLILLEHILG